MNSAARGSRPDPGPRQGKRALLVVNRRSRSGREGTEETTACLSALGFDVTLVSDEDPSNLPDAISAKCAGQDLVIVAGGDGSVNLALEPVLQSGLPLGLIPLGTANDLVRTLEIPATIDEACRVIAAGHMRRINLGRVGNKLFVNVASLGLSTAVARFHRGERKRRWHVLSYLFSVWDALKVTRPFRATITCDGVRHRHRCLQISIGNGVYYGGGMAISADASIEQETLDLTIIRPTSFWTLLRLTPALRFGTHGRHPEATTTKCRRLRIETRRPRPINADGELLARTPAEFSIVPGALQVFAPYSQETE